MVFRGSQGPGAEGERRFIDETRTVDTVIGVDTHFEGKIRGNSNVDINGDFEGEIDVQGRVWLRSGGKLTADVKATDVVLEGVASGKFTATNKIDLREKARVEGEITSNSIVMAEGSIFEGSITKTSEDKKPKVVKYKEKRTSTAAPPTPE